MMCTHLRSASVLYTLEHGAKLVLFLGIMLQKYVV